MHTDNTQIYLVTNGSGTVVVESEVAPENVYLVAPGEQRAGVGLDGGGAALGILLQTVPDGTNARLKLSIATTDVVGQFLELPPWGRGARLRLADSERGR